MTDLGGPFARQRQLRVGHGRQELAQLGAAEGMDDAGRAGAREGRPRMRAWATGLRTKAACSMSRKLDVGDELAPAGQQPAILPARDRTADIIRSLCAVVIASFACEPSFSLCRPHRRRPPPAPP